MATKLEDLARGVPARGAVWLSGEWLTDFLRCLIADRARAGANIDELPTEKGRVFNARADGSGGGTLSYPFDVSIGQEGGVTKAYFYPGEANGLVPENVLKGVAVVAGGLNYAFVRVHTDGTKVQKCVTMVATAAPDPQTPTLNSLPRQVDVVVAIIDYTPPVGSSTTATYTPYRTFFPRANILLRPVEYGHKDVDDPQPGQLPYDNYYYWEVVGTTDDS